MLIRGSLEIICARVFNSIFSSPRAFKSSIITAGLRKKIYNLFDLFLQIVTPCNILLFHRGNRKVIKSPFQLRSNRECATTTAKEREPSHCAVFSGLVVTVTHYVRDRPAKQSKTALHARCVSLRASHEKSYAPQLITLLRLGEWVQYSLDTCIFRRVGLARRKPSSICIDRFCRRGISVLLQDVVQRSSTSVLSVIRIKQKIGRSCVVRRASG
jgi:hypothetical protein